MIEPTNLGAIVRGHPDAATSKWVPWVRTSRDPDDDSPWYSDTLDRFTSWEALTSSPYQPTVLSWGTYLGPVLTSRFAIVMDPMGEPWIRLDDSEYPPDAPKAKLEMDWLHADLEPSRKCWADIRPVRIISHGEES